MFALAWTAQIHTDRYADEPHTSITVGNINTADDALTAVQAITAFLSYPHESAAQEWLVERFGALWLTPLRELANELPPAFWVDMIDPTGHRCHTGLSPAAAIVDQDNLQVIKIGG